MHLQNLLNSRLFAILRLMLLSIFAATCIANSAENNVSGENNPDNLVGHGGPIKALAISQDGLNALTGSFDYSAMLWGFEPGKKPRLLSRYADHDGAVNAVAFVGSNGRFITAGDDGSIYLWDTKSQKLIYRYYGHQGKILSVAVSPNHKFAASASWDRSVRLWNLENGQQLAVLKEHKGPANAVLISSDGRHVFSAGYDGAIIKWDAESGRLVRVIYKHGWGINVMQWLPEKKQILFGTINGDVRIFDLITNTIAKILIPHQRPVLALASSKDGKFVASGGGDGLIRVWKLADWSVVEELQSAFGPVWAMDFGKDSTKLYYAGLDDYAVYWKISPRKIEDEIQSKYPRRFQKFNELSLGERQFARKCSICHTLKPGDKNRAGPSLNRVFGRQAGTLKGYPYSDGLLKSQIIWNENTIDELFALGPQHVTPGSKMPLQKIAQKHKRDALILFLKEHTN